MVVNGMCGGLLCSSSIALRLAALTRLTDPPTVKSTVKDLNGSSRLDSMA